MRYVSVRIRAFMDFCSYTKNLGVKFIIELNWSASKSRIIV